MKEWSSDFNKKFRSVWGCGVGWNKWNGGCYRLCEDMSAFQYVEEADAKNYDSRVPAEFQDLVWELRYEALSARHQTPKIKALFDLFKDEVINTLVLSSNGEWYQKSGGNPSGSPCTTEDNTLIGIMLFVLQAIRSGISHNDMMQESKLMQCGDDVLFACSDKVAKLRFGSRVKLLDEVGMDWPVEKFRWNNTCEGLTYLGNTFVKKKLYDRSKFWAWVPARPGKWVSTLLEAEAEVSPAEYLECVRGILMESCWDDDNIPVLQDIEDSVRALVDENDVLPFFRYPVDVHALRLRSLGFEAKSGPDNAFEEESDERERKECDCQSCAARGAGGFGQKRAK